MRVANLVARFFLIVRFHRNYFNAWTAVKQTLSELALYPVEEEADFPPVIREFANDSDCGDFMNRLATGAGAEQCCAARRERHLGIASCAGAVELNQVIGQSIFPNGVSGAGALPGFQSLAVAAPAT